MKGSVQNDLIEKYINKYSKVEFEFIISLLPYAKVSDVIKKNEKRFREYTKGFNLQKLSLKKLQEIYYKSIFKSQNDLLVKHTELIINEFLRNIDEHISKAIEPAEYVRQKVENNDMKCFKELTALLLDYKFDSKEKVLIYFKMIDYELSENQINYISHDLEHYIYQKRIEEDLKKKISESYEIKIQEVSKQYEKLILDKEDQIIALKQLMEESKGNYVKELSLKDSLIKEIEKNHIKILDRVEQEHRQDITKKDKLEISLEQLNTTSKEKNELINSLRDIVELKYDEYCEIANKRWIEDNDKLIVEKNAIQSSINTLMSEKGNLVYAINELETLKSSLEEMITSLEGTGSGFLHNMQNLIQTIGYKSESPMNQSRLHIIPSKAIEIDQEVTTDKSFFVDDLADNLRISGISNEYSNDLAQYIFASISSKMSLLLVGCNTRKVANALSSIINGANAEIIIIPVGYDDCNELILNVTISTSKVILIENAVDNISESIYLPLLKENTDHILLFSMESAEHISMIPKSLMNYMIVVDIDSLVNYEPNPGELIKSVIDPNLFNVKLEPVSIRTNLRHIKPIDRFIKLSQVAIIKLAEVMSSIDKQNTPNALYDIIMFSLNMLCKQSGKTNELLEFVEQQEFSPVLNNMLRAAIGDNNNNE
ncbi:hypothetical protein [Paenibacillus mendelii]|uniref:Uncharacterized protein n=1 Tax=Paenibacillus mendelii TaxID=206163 RepID=A0ABV6JCA6_9BACL|nr:hypothetical protein [Paenibacillus mendelii]MCQ6561536.1 hypothetical protein [Paenibacillus mendelii]